VGELVTSTIFLKDSDLHKEGIGYAYTNKEGSSKVIKIRIENFKMK
jgi:hypothetical protein